MMHRPGIRALERRYAVFTRQSGGHEAQHGKPTDRFGARSTLSHFASCRERSSAARIPFRGVTSSGRRPSSSADPPTKIPFGSRHRPG